MYETFDHTADVGLRIRSPDRARLYADAASGLTSIIAGRPEQVRPSCTETFDVAGEDPAFLLFDWLNELLYAFEARRMLFRHFEVTTDEHGLRAVARGERYDPERHALAHEVKAITYHGLSVTRTADGWVATVIVDI